MIVLVAGSSGLAGSAIALAFEKQGHKVVRVNRGVVDLLDLDATRNLVLDINPDLIVDAAARVGGIGANNSFPVEFLVENIRMQTNLMQSAHEMNVEKFVFLGSSCIYPRECSQPIKEEYLLTGPLESTNSAYAIAKIAGIELVKSYRKEFGAKWISLTPTNLYGPRDNFNLAFCHVLPALIRRFIEAEQLSSPAVVLWGTGTPRREFLHVDDLANAVVLVSDQYDSSLHVNIGTGEDITIFELAKMVARISGFKGEIVWDSTQPDGTSRKVLDVSRIKAMGWKPSIKLDDGIASTIEWYKKAVEKGEVRL